MRAQRALARDEWTFENAKFVNFAMGDWKAIQAVNRGHLTFLEVPMLSMVSGADG